MTRVGYTLISSHSIIHVYLTSNYSVVKTLGFNTTITLVMTCPPFLFAGAAGIFCGKSDPSSSFLFKLKLNIIIGWSSGRYHERTLHITAGLIIAIVGFVMAASTLNTAARYVACFIFPVGAYSVSK